jgi:hypothetical protein
MTRIALQSPQPRLSFIVEPQYFEALQGLPWHHPLDEWKSFGVKLLDIKHGQGRHPVVFVKGDRQNFVVKELPLEGARREQENYRAMLHRGIHTLVPIGFLVREDAAIPVSTQIGAAYEPNIVGFSITLLLDRVLPDSLLYRRAFKPESRRRIWDAIVDLFVELHSNGIYWGDASLANVLVKFLKVDIPYVGKKTQLKAFLADAETVEIHDSISDSLRQQDLDFFFESMEWINEDLRASGILRDALATVEDRAYIQHRYDLLYDVAQREKEFNELTGLQLRSYLGPVRYAVYLDTLRKHIAEHKWYLSEEAGQEVSFAEAAENWLRTVFVPVCQLFTSEGVLRYFPEKTAAELYVDVMTHKYYLSQERGADVGIMAALRDYARRFPETTMHDSLWIQLAKKLALLLGRGPRLLLGLID